MRSTVIAAGCVAALLAATACSSDETEGSGEDVAAQKTPSSAPQATPNRPIPTKPIPNDVDKRQAVAIEKCAATKNGWHATGTAQNPDDETQTYEITIFFTTTSATVIDYARTEVTVEPGETERWKAAAKFTAPAESRCVLRGVG